MMYRGVNIECLRCGHDLPLDITMDEPVIPTHCIRCNQRTPDFDRLFSELGRRQLGIAYREEDFNCPRCNRNLRVAVRANQRDVEYPDFTCPECNLMMHGQEVDHLINRRGGTPGILNREMTGRPFSAADMHRESNRMFAEMSQQLPRRQMRGIMPMIEWGEPTKKKEKPKQKPKEIPEYMEADYEKIPKEIRDKIEKHFIGTHITTSPELQKHMEGDVERHKMVQLTKTLADTLAERDAIEKTGEYEDGHDTIEMYETYAFKVDDWIRIVIDVFYAGFDYANEHNKKK